MPPPALPSADRTFAVISPPYMEKLADAATDTPAPAVSTMLPTIAPPYIVKFAPSDTSTPRPDMLLAWVMTPPSMVKLGLV